MVSLLDIQMQELVLWQMIGNLILVLPDDLWNIVVNEILQSCIDIDEHAVHIIVVLLDVLHVTLEQHKRVPLGKSIFTSFFEQLCLRFE